MKKVFIPLFLSLFLQSAFAYDALGTQFTQKTATNTKAFVAVLQPATNFSVQTITENGVTIEDYISTSNQIFAVTWSGVVQPDLSTLLGDYTNTPTTPSAPKNHRQMTSEGPDFVIGKHYEGQLKRGFAYVKSLVPQGFNISTLSK